MTDHFPRFAEKRKPPGIFPCPRIGQPGAEEVDNLPLMDYKNEIGRRIRAARAEKQWTLSDLSQKTGDVLSLKRINSYENGDRMPGPAEATILAKALGVRPAYLMAVDDIQTPISPKEEALVRNWRKLPENERMEFFRKLATTALRYADPIADHVVERHLPKTTPHPKGRRSVIRPEGDD